MKKNRCWEGYEPVPGKKPYSDDSCAPKKSMKKGDLVDMKTKKVISSTPTKQTDPAAVVRHSLHTGAGPVKGTGYIKPLNAGLVSEAQRVNAKQSSAAPASKLKRAAKKAVAKGDLIDMKSKKIISSTPTEESRPQAFVDRKGKIRPNDRFINDKVESRNIDAMRPAGMPPRKRARKA
jgi:hypothetical protein